MYCSGPLLDRVQRLHIFNDSKTFVDMPMLQDPEAILELFNSLGGANISRDDLTAFLAANFADAGSDVQQWVPPDYTPSPPFLDSIRSSSEEDWRWASSLNELWLLLGKKVTDDVQRHPQRHSFVPRRFV